MISKFDKFILEKHGFPNSVKPYSDIVYDKCLERLEHWLKSKGKFYNLSDSFTIGFKEIRKNVIDKDFKDFPIERLKVNFKISVIKDKKEHGFDATSYTPRTYSVENPPKSYWVNSHITGKTLFTEIELVLKVAGKSNSYPIEESKNTLRTIINHELTHVYEYTKNSSINFYFYNAISDITKQIEDIYVLKRIRSINLFLFLLYYIEPIEMNATISEDRYKSEIMKDKSDTINMLINYNAEKEYNKYAEDRDEILRKFEWYRKRKGYKLKEMEQKRKYIAHDESGELPWMERLGEHLSKEYYLYGGPKSRKMDKISKMNLLELFSFFEPIFHKAGEKMRRKSLLPKD